MKSCLEFVYAYAWKETKIYFATTQYAFFNIPDEYQRQSIAHGFVSKTF